LYGILDSETRRGGESVLTKEAPRREGEVRDIPRKGANGIKASDLVGKTRGTSCGGLLEGNTYSVVRTGASRGKK